MSSDRIHDAVLCAERRGRTPARSIDAAIVTEQAYGCNCRSANGNTATVRHTISPAYGRNLPGLRNGVMHAPVASAVPSAEVTNLQGSYAAPESTGVAILRKALPSSFHRAPSDALIHYFFFAPSWMMDTNRLDFELAHPPDKPQTAHQSLFWCHPAICCYVFGIHVLRLICVNLRNLRLSSETRLTQPPLQFFIFRNLDSQVA
jgi:hypothetical protein